MYPSIKSSSIKEEQAIKIVGEEAVEKLKSINCDFTGRLIDDCYNVVEMSASIDCKHEDGNDCLLTILYLINKDDLDNCGDDLGNLDYSDYTFEIN